MPTAPQHYRFLTPKRCATCHRTVFAVDDLGDCPGCRRTHPIEEAPCLT